MNHTEEYIQLLENLGKMLKTNPEVFSEIQNSIGTVSDNLLYETKTLSMLAEKWTLTQQKSYQLQKRLFDARTPQMLIEVFSDIRSLLQSALRDDCFNIDYKDSRLSYNSDPDISVVMTLYKRPDVLLEQLKAIENQTIKPKEILLFQDGIDSDVYSISLKKDILKRFSDVCISPNNLGVWERFSYADKNCSCDYICLFDDDTIPGDHWLENCFFHITRQEAIYVTIGITLLPHSDYPQKNYYRAGWAAPCQTDVEVDFGGHSWFMKREHLKTMVETSKEVRDSDTMCVGEDIWLSYSNLRENNIKTVVPQHYLSDLSYWGSKPDKAKNYGTQSQAVSMQASNLQAMKLFLKKPVFKEWNTLCDRYPEYVNHIYSQVESIDGNPERNPD